MLTFDYEANNSKTGQKVKAQIEAEDEQAAADLIRKEGLTPITIKPVGGKTYLKVLNRVSSKDKVLFARQLSTLLNAGLPLVQALRSTADQTQSKPLKMVVNSIVSNIEAGTSFSAALSRHKDVFNNVFINLVAAGEASGTLDKALERLAIQQEKDADIAAKVRSAFSYPVIVLIVMGFVVGFMLVKVLPAVQTLYNGLPGVHLPIETRLLLSLSHDVIHYWWIVGIIVAGCVIFIIRWKKTITGRSAIDKFKMKAWPFGPLMMKLYMARFSRTAATLVTSGVPLIQVLEITAGAVNNYHVTKSINKAIEKVKGGRALSEALTKDPNFLPLVPSMLKIGEQSGTIDKMLERVAEYYETEVDNEIKTISTLMEPLLMIILGIFAFILVAAVLLPIYSLASNPALTSAF